MHSETQRARLVLWVFIFSALTLGSGAYWFWSGKYQGKAAEKLNASQTNTMTSTPLTVSWKSIYWKC